MNLSDLTPEVRDIVRTIQWVNAELFDCTMSERLRTAAAYHPEATNKQFVQACVFVGYRANTAANRFSESRRISRMLDKEEVWA